MNYMVENALLAWLEDHGQEHILQHLANLEPEQQAFFWAGLKELDLETVFRLYQQFSSLQKSPHQTVDVNNARMFNLPITADELRQRDEAKTLGAEALRQRKVAVLVVAGGQGSRLGFNGPKGMFPITPLKHKSLFQLFAEKVVALEKKYQARIPVLIMVSRENNRVVCDFFKAHDNFGLELTSLDFIEQEMLPAITPEGKLLLRDETSLFTSPNGHGGALKALQDAGCLDRLTADGYSTLFYCQIDNPLVKIADQVFIGYHLMQQAEISTKVVRRQSCEEKVGIFMSVNGRTQVVEYSELDPENYCRIGMDGQISDWAGNTAIHLLSLSFIKRLNQEGFKLPYHRVEKKVRALAENRQFKEFTAWKFETFIFDAIPLAQSSSCMEVERTEEFAPLKNREGPDSPESVRAALLGLYHRWLQKAELKIDPGAKVEISPDFALECEDFCNKLRTRPESSVPYYY